MKPAFLALILATTLMATQANAAIVSYTDRASFAAAAGTGVTEDFSAATPGLFPSEYLVPFEGFTATGTTNTNNVGIGTGTFANYGDDSPIPAAFSGQNFFGWGNGSAGGAIGTITITFGSPVTAFGFDWFNTDYSDQYGVTIGTSAFTAPPFTVAPNGTTTGFFGIVSDAAITSFTISVIEYGGYISTEGFDNLSYSPVAVPEPATLALLAAGVIGAAAARRRRTA